MKKRILLILFSYSLLVFGLNSQTITIAAAADVRYAMDELKTEFRKFNPDINIEVIYGSSGNLFQQILNQAPYDIFFAADISYPKKLDSLHLAGSVPKIYAIGHLVLWSATIDLSDGIDVLKSNKVRKISIANPAVAPYGKRAIEFLKFYHIYADIQEKIVKGENVSQAAQFVLTGNAEVGLIALSLALSPEMMSQGKYFPVEDISYSELDQGYVIIKNSEIRKDVQNFIQFIETDPAKKIFRKYGFKMPDEK